MRPHPLGATRPHTYGWYSCRGRTGDSTVSDFQPLAIALGSILWIRASRPQLHPHAPPHAHPPSPARSRSRSPTFTHMLTLTLTHLHPHAHASRSPFTLLPWTYGGTGHTPSLPRGDASSSTNSEHAESFRISRSHQLNIFSLGYATAPVEGRIAVEYFDPSPAIQEKRYTFKCHHQTIDDADHVWPVNALAFHPTYNTFASGDSDASVSIWDHKVKKRLRRYTKYNAPVAALAFSADGSRLAIGASYTWDTVHRWHAQRRSAPGNGATHMQAGNDGAHAHARRADDAFVDAAAAALPTYVDSTVLLL